MSLATALITLDFETYFADDYTLSKMTTEEYVRDARFKMLCKSLKVDNQQAGDRLITHNWFKDKPVVCHHAHFDGLILSHHFKTAPLFWFDTLSMARLLFPHAKSHSLGALAELLGLPKKTVPYESFKNIRDLPPDLYNRVAAGCAQDVELTHAIFKAMLPHMPKDELRIIDLNVRLFTEPKLNLERDSLAQYIKDNAEQQEHTLASLGVTKEDLGSSEKFAALLEACGVEPPTKISKTTGQATYAFAKTDSALKELQEHDDDRVSALVNARLGVKSNTVKTRAQRMLDMDMRGAMCVYLKYYGAHPGRFSGGDKMNWQNFKRSNEQVKSVVRESILAPEGQVIVVVDASQIEARLLDWWAGQWDMLDKFRRKEDIYSDTASAFYGEPVDKSMPDKRGMGKQIILSCGFGAGADSIKNTARIGTYGPPVYLTDAQALAARDLYRRLHPQVVKLWRYANNIVLPALLRGTDDFAWGPCRVRGKRIYMPALSGEGRGAWIDYSNLHYNGEEYYQVRRKGISKTYGGKIVQNVIEGLSRTILCANMLKIAAHYPIVTDTHDEIVYLASEEQGQLALDFGLHVVQTPPAWCADIPLAAEGGYARNYSK